VTYFPTHRYEKAGDGDWCAAPMPEDRDLSICARLTDHPIHAVDRPEIGELAQALASHRWRLDGPGDWSVHRVHIYSADCALCRGDVHAIAAVVLEILR